MTDIRLCTIQPWEVWEALQSRKTLFVDPAHSNFSDEGLIGPYNWMREQMRLRLPGYGGRYPWWAYDYKLDLRRCRFWYPPGPYVRMELDVPQNQVLLSTYGYWHRVLNRRFLPYSMDDETYTEEYDGWKAELKQHGLDPDRQDTLPEPWESRIIASWRRIFDVEELRATNTIQACFECLDLAHVKRVTVFEGKGAPWDTASS